MFWFFWTLQNNYKLFHLWGYFVRIQEIVFHVFRLFFLKSFSVEIGFSRLLKMLTQPPKIDFMSTFTRVEFYKFLFHLPVIFPIMWFSSCLITSFPCLVFEDAKSAFKCFMNILFFFRICDSCDACGCQNLTNFLLLIRNVFPFFLSLSLIHLMLSYFLNNFRN